VAGTNPKPVDGELAQLAAAVYNDEGAPPGWTKLSDEQLAAAGINPALLDDPSTGFKAGIYMNDKGQVVLSYAGTSMTSWQDWKNNLGQGLGWGAAQYTQAVALAQDAKLAFGDNMVITGHSLGGGLAATAAIATNTTAVTFNAAGVHDDTIKSLGLDPKKVREQTENGQIRRYVVDGEILTHVQEHAIPSKWVAPDGLGKKIVLNDPNPLNWKQKLIPGAETKHRVDNHMMTEVQDALRKDPQW
jgi:hypothetical protein